MSYKNKAIATKSFGTTTRQCCTDFSCSKTEKHGGRTPRPLQHKHKTKRRTHHQDHRPQQRASPQAATVGPNSTQIHAAVSSTIVTADAPSQADVPYSDGDAARVEGAQVGLFKELDQVVLGGLPQEVDSRRVELSVLVQVQGRALDELLERQLHDERVSALLERADFPQSRGPRTAVPLGPCRRSTARALPRAPVVRRAGATCWHGVALRRTMVPAVWRWRWMQAAVEAVAVAVEVAMAVAEVWSMAVVVVVTRPWTAVPVVVRRS